MREATILVNAIRTPDGTVIRSHTRHDMCCHVDANGHEYCVDGGLDYLRRTWSDGAPRAEDMSVYSDDPHSLIRESLQWGTRGPDGSEPLRWIALKDMTANHIRACLNTQPHMRPAIRTAMINELDYRGELKYE